MKKKGVVTPVVPRIILPPNKRHKSEKDYNRKRDLEVPNEDSNQ